MINAFDNDTRCLDVEIKIYLNGDRNEPLIINNDNYLVSFNVLEELSSDDIMCDSISSNEFEFEIYNNDDMFTPTNENGPYYGLLETNVKVEVNMREELSETDWITLGTFYIYDWNCNQGASTAVITCNDRMLNLINLPTPTYMVKQNVSVYTFLTELFTLVGLKASEYNIDDVLKSQIINYAYPIVGKFGDTLVEIAKSHMCYIYVDRNDIVRVKSLRIPNDVISIWNDDNQIISSKVISTLQKENSGVMVTYHNKSITEEYSLVTLSEQVLQPGETEFPNVLIEKGPLYKAAHCLTESKNLTYVSGITYSPWDISLKITNTYTKSEVATITIYGSTISTEAKSCVSDYDKTLVNRVGIKMLEIEGEYIDSESHANLLKSAFMRYISNPTPIIELTTRGNPCVTIGDVITINDNTNKIHRDLVITRQQFRYDGSLECTVGCIDKSIMEGVL